MWVATLEQDGKTSSIHIEATRWFDARGLALRLSSGLPVLLAPSLMEKSQIGEWWRLRWAGSPLDPRDQLHLEACVVALASHGDDNNQWSLEGEGEWIHVNEVFGYLDEEEFEDEDCPCIEDERTADCDDCGGTGSISPHNDPVYK